MGLWDWIKGAASKVGEAIKSGVSKVGEVFKDPASLLQKVGDIGGKIVEGAKTILPYVGNIPLIGTAAKAIAGAGGLVKGIQDVGQAIGRGDIGGAIESGISAAAPLLPTPIGKTAMKILPVLGAARREFDF